MQVSLTFFSRSSDFALYLEVFSGSNDLALYLMIMSQYDPNFDRIFDNVGHGDLHFMV